MTLSLSVNVNKVATLRNARGGDLPSVTRAALTCVEAGCHGITVHPRPDERHIRRHDVFDLKRVLPGHVEFNIEGYPSDDFLDLIAEIRPHQCTLVPDPPGVLTSDAGWDLSAPQPRLDRALARLSDLGVRSSIFLAADQAMVRAAATTGADRIELYTGPYAEAWGTEAQDAAFAPYRDAAALADTLGLGVNAGHDLSQANLGFFAQHIPALAEVSIGHALIGEALYEGLTATVKAYLRILREARST